MAFNTLVRYALGGALVLPAAVAVWKHGQSPEVSRLERSAVLARQSAVAIEGTVVDPLVPGRPPLLIGPQPDGRWITARPDARYGYSRPSSERSGIEPCATPEPEPGRLTPWHKLSSFGQFVAPESLLRSDATEFDLIVHFHGHEPARKELGRAGVPLVLFGVSLDPGQSYARLLAGGAPMTAVLEEVQRALSKQSGRSMTLRRLAVTAWSAGFVGVRAVMREPVFERVDAVVLLDGLHTPRDAAQLPGELADFVELGRRASRGEKWFAVTHSSIDPPTFSSTTETAHHLLAALGEQPLRVRRTDAYGLELVEFHSRGNFHVRGYAGNDKADHCAQFGAYRDLLSALARRFRDAG